MDRISKEHRSWNMSQIRSSNTGPERAVRSMLHRMGFRFALQRKDLPGKPDIVLPRYNSVVMVHGCFWHRHEVCPYAYKPRSRVEFWESKFEENVLRDKEVHRQLEELGWNVITVWECELGEPEALAERLEMQLRS